MDEDNRRRMEHTLQKNYKDWIRKILVIFMASQPLLDLYMNLLDETVRIFDVSLATILRFGVVFCMLLVLAFYERKRKATRLFFIYAGVVAVYAVLHHINAAAFSVELAQAQYRVVEELFYLVRMCVPVALIYIIYIVRLGYRDVKTIVLWSALTVSVVIIVTNLLKIGFMAYQLNDITITGTMVDWFFSDLEGVDWWALSCRGLFQSTNQLSGVLVMLTPVLTYICLREKKIRYWVVMAMHLVGMINLSTRIASIGGPVAFGAIVLVYFFENLLHKKLSLKKVLKGNTVFVVACSLFAILFLLHSPMSLRAQSGAIFDDILSNPHQGGDPGKDTTEDPFEERPGNTDSECPGDGQEGRPSHSGDNSSSKPSHSGGNSSQNPSGDSQLTKAQMIAYIEKHFPTSGIQPLFINEAYPYTEDPQFWYHIIKDVPESQRYGNRNMRGYIIERLFERDDRITNRLLGISYTRSSSFIWPERDIETHLDSLGIVGTVLFIGPYFAILGFGVICFFRKLKENLYLGKCIYLLVCGLGILIAYFSGHIMDEIFPSLYLACFSGLLLQGAVPEQSTGKEDAASKEE